MAYVPRTQRLIQIKTKLAFNLTKRQLVCFSSAAAVGLPAYLFSRGSIGNSAAMFLMIGLMLPALGVGPAALEAAAFLRRTGTVECRLRSCCSLSLRNVE